MHRQKICTILTLAILSHCFAFAQVHVRDVPLEVTDILYFLGGRHLTFEITTEKEIRALSYHVDLYEEGKVVSTGQTFSDETVSGKKHRFSVIFSETEDQFQVMVRPDNAPARFNIKKTTAHYFPFSLPSAVMDEDGRIVLAY